jgi:hypothetical protein
MIHKMAVATMMVMMEMTPAAMLIPLQTVGCLAVGTGRVPMVTTPEEVAQQAVLAAMMPPEMGMRYGAKQSDLLQSPSL